MARTFARPSLPRSLRALAEAEQACERCELHRVAPRAVPGAGPRSARIMLVGEQPGDREDRVGAPFVGPAGVLLDQALEDAGLDRTDVFATNSVKRFRHELRGKRRIHKKPALEHVRACRPWLDAELAIIRPAVVVCLGVTAAQSLIGSGTRLGDVRGRRVVRAGLPVIVATAHPAAVLRSRDGDARRRAYEELVEDLRGVARMIAED